MPVGLGKIPKLLPVKGIEVAACCAGISKKKRKDLALIYCRKKVNFAAVFTQNKFCAAPVIIAKKHIQTGNLNGCLINSGNANAGLGKHGEQSALETCRCLASCMNTKTENILPFSTGLIAEPLPVNKITKAIPDLCSQLTENAWNDVADAILTTDTTAKGISRQLTLAEGNITITAIAKGSGMIRPNMATMLAFIATDANINQIMLQNLLDSIVRQSFNCINVDGDTSPNDSCLIIATGESGIRIKSFEDDVGLMLFNTLMEMCVYLAQAIVRDGEGATKFISIYVTAGISEQECREVALTIANSPLVKTAFFASDPNVGRIIAAIGRSMLPDLDMDKISISLNDLIVFEDGQMAKFYTESKGKHIMQNEEIALHISLGRGQASSVIWTCDLSNEYIHINSNYRS